MSMNRSIKVSVTLLMAVAMLAAAGPWLSPHDYITTNFDRLLASPSLFDMHLFGTDDLGRDLFVRTMLGVRVTLVVAIVASLVSLIIGVA